MHMANLLDQLAPELIPFILKNLSIQELKKCCITVKALIDFKSFHGSISKALAKNMNLYISEEYGLRYLAIRDLGIGITNASKKVMRRGWINREEVSITLPNIFNEIVPSSYLGIHIANFVVVDKPEYDLV
ncbi:hypothetical protein C1645_833328 [Glomus cerebriforme]|uniref:Uncharacterized protein n=1 Tax=Glomus cerebriforme TaxID=658196 RepID=A0A397SCQ0_9GLOM|nr:hypothetical protein C1645_833328 [Glomus cerebriforme]